MWWWWWCFGCGDGFKISNVRKKECVREKESVCECESEREREEASAQDTKYGQVRQ